MKISSVVDWCEFTRTGSLCNPKDFLPEMEGWELEEVIRPAAHYSDAWRCQNGAIIMRGVDERQGMRVIVPGQPMQEIRATMGDMAIIRFAHTDRRKPTRIDVTLDMVGNDTPHASVFAKHVTEGKIKTRARSFDYHAENLEEGFTQYIGSPTSGKRMRIYDYRAKHLNALWDAWTRVELQSGGDYARAIGQDIMRNGVRDAACVWCKGFVDFPEIPEYQEATNPTVNFEPEEVPRKQTNWQKWLLKTVTASCEKAIGTRREETVREFASIINAMLDDTCT